jgi:mannose-6-phosphate isomerase class I
MKTKYDKFPKIRISDNSEDCISGWQSILHTISEKLGQVNKQNKVIAIDVYQGVSDEEIEIALKKYLKPSSFFLTQKAFKSEKEIEEMVFPDVTDDRIFGHMTSLGITDFFDSRKLSDLKKEITEDLGNLKVIYGHGASLFGEADVLVYVDMARWEIQLRMRNNELGNLGVFNSHIDIALRYKQSFFVDWRVLDRHKMSIFDKCDFVVDANKKSNPKMLTREKLASAYKKVIQQPFRVVPFFDPGPWGGQWMKEVMDLDPSAINYAWSFDCVPEENSILLSFGDITFEAPAINLTLKEPQALLGDRVYEKFGAEFPIRFDFLDTMEGGNLSLQVHPSNEYVKEKFGMPYTQDESYYIMEAKEDAVVYLGFKNEVQPEKMISELKEAQEKGTFFDADKHVAKYQIKKHDHILIPNGTVHCSGENSVVLEISATPYIFTFKLWDWGRLGLDGLPRPINIEHGEQVIDWSRKEDFSKEELINKIEKVDEGNGWIEERTGLHPTVFIETRRHWFTSKVPHQTFGSVNVLNLVEGEEAVVESPDGTFEPFVIRYAETFIVPASVKEYTIRPYGASIGKKCATMKAFVRQ